MSTPVDVVARGTGTGDNTLFYEEQTVGPLYSPTAGKWYIFGGFLATAADSKINIYGSDADPPSSFSLRTQLTAPISAGTVELQNRIAFEQKGDLVHLLYCTREVGTGQYEVYYMVYDMSSESFSISSELVWDSGGTNNGSNNSGATNLGLVVRDNGEVVALFNGDDPGYPTDLMQVHYSRRTGTATWTTPVRVGAAEIDETSNAAYVTTAVKHPQNDSVLFLLSADDSAGARAYFLSESNQLSVGPVGSTPGGYPYGLVQGWGIGYVNTLGEAWAAIGMVACTFTLKFDNPDAIYDHYPNYYHFGGCFYHNNTLYLPSLEYYHLYFQYATSVDDGKSWALGSSLYSQDFSAGVISTCAAYIPQRAGGNGQFIRAACVEDYTAGMFRYTEWPVDGGFPQATQYSQEVLLTQ